jgi:hypothetical protein
MCVKVIEAVDYVCKKLGISYKSPNHEQLSNYKADAQKLADIYLQLKQIIAEITYLKEKYPALEAEFNIDIYDLDKTDHHLVIEAKKILKKGEKEAFKQFLKKIDGGDNEK